MALLLFDVGNSRLKFALWKNKQLGKVHAVPYTRPDLLHILQEHFGSETAFDGVYVSNVAGAEVQQTIIQYFSDRQVDCLFARSAANFGGLVNAYINPEQLGVDRWLAMISVSQCFSGPFCVVDCGTAITIDAVGLNGHHLGGFILPGVASMKTAINDSAESIRLSELERPIGMFGRNTSQAVSNGIIQSIVALIEKSFYALEQECGTKVTCVLSGGDAELIKHALPFTVDVETNLVLKGLAINFGLS